MTDRELLIDIITGFSGWMKWALTDATPEMVVWQPDGEANSIALTLWHVSRAFDVLRARILEGEHCEAEFWYVDGLANQTGYDPRGKGWGGLGNLAGYSQAEANEVPLLPLDDLLDYFERSTTAVCGRIAEMSEEELYLPAVGWPGQEPQTAYACIRNFLMDSIAHLGEIRAIRAMWERRFEPTEG